ncbi:MAG TPA: 2Fe-2S iron-sulfur cluster-binding protein [Mycobacteriales bacterium]|nr:2Fe-2S iron-sulfur cluster-binding protein [Mycobacteriales bacterium]
MTHPTGTTESTRTAEAGPTIEVPLVVNGHHTVVRVPPDEPLLHTLRDAGHRDLRGTCGIGVCGTCTVLVDGRVVSSCILLTAQARGRAVTTAAGLRDSSGGLSPVQRAFLRANAFQCSFCTPAMTLAVHAALHDPQVRRDAAGIREFLAGNLCRCGSYPDVLAAVTDLLDRDGEPNEGDVR